MTRIRPARPLYYSGSTVVAAIAVLALMLTGQRFPQGVQHRWSEMTC
jgi:hypothetical protein